MNPKPGSPSDEVHSYADFDSEQEHKSPGLPDPHTPPLHPSFEDARYSDTSANRGEERSDPDIREDLNRDALLHPSLETMDISFTVQDGIVTLWGEVDTPQIRRMLQERVTSYPGIKGLNNQIRIAKRNKASDLGPHKK